MGIPLTLSFRPSASSTRVLVMHDQDEVLKAVLPPAHLAHPRAAATLCEALALWYQKRLSVVLSAAEPETSSVLGLSDVLGLPLPALHYDVEVRLPGRGRRLAGLGSFHDLRQLCLRGVR
jgi:hypothetical protein